jgi:acetyl esterase/lipase
MNEEIIPKIATNTMIYVPIDEGEQSGDIFAERKNTIPVRILHHEPLPRLAEGKQADGSALEDICIHMHGGGYIVLSSNGTQVYTRQWANLAKVPVFSIDYRLAPGHPFPEPAYDCLRVYKFITENIHRYFNIKPKNIYLGGDSAGGNLACALTTLILKRGLTVPKGLLLAYPNLDARKVFYGSRKFTLNDTLLWPSLIKVAYKNYFPDETALTNPLASPLLLTEGYLSGKEGDNFPSSWPTTYIEVGTEDALRD